MSMPTLTYFSSRGLSELIRVILAEAEVEYQEVNLGTYHPADQPSDFEALKASGKLAFGAVPLWEEPSGLSLVQSDAIVRHLARTHQLYGRTAAEAARIDVVAEGVKDIRLNMRKIQLAEPAKRAAERENVLSTVLPRWLGYLNAMLEANAQQEASAVDAQHSRPGFFVGSTLSYADLSVWLLLESIIDNGLAAPLEQYPALVAFEQRIRQRPRVQAWIDSPRRFPKQLLPV